MALLNMYLRVILEWHYAVSTIMLNSHPTVRGQNYFMSSDFCKEDTLIGPIKQGTNVEFKFLAMPNVDFEMRVPSVDFEYEQSKSLYAYGAHIICLLKVESRVSG